VRVTDTELGPAARALCAVATGQSAWLTSDSGATTIVEMKRVRLSARRLQPAVVAVAIGLGACSSPAPTVSNEASDGTYSLTLTAPAGSVRTTDALDIRAALDYRGPGSSVIVTAPDTGLVTIWFEQLDGPLRMSANSRLMCSGPFTLSKGASTVFQPIGDAKPGGDLPSLPVYQRWQSDPEVRLPAGRWKITAHATVYQQTTCGSGLPDHELTTSVTLTSSS
jgi:hypothetical protein